MKNAAKIRNKAFAGIELVAAGAALTGGAMLLEEAATPKKPPVPGHDNVYATDNGASLFKVETLGGQEDEITTSEVIGWVILICLFILLVIIFARAIIRIKKTCGQDTSMFKIGKIKKEKEVGHENTSSRSDPQAPASSRQIEMSDQSLEEAIKKARENFAALSSIKESTK